MALLATSWQPWKALRGPATVLKFDSRNPPIKDHAWPVKYLAFLSNRAHNLPPWGPGFETGRGLCWCASEQSKHFTKSFGNGWKIRSPRTCQRRSDCANSTAASQNVRKKNGQPASGESGRLQENWGLRQSPRRLPHNPQKS